MNHKVKWNGILPTRLNSLTSNSDWHLISPYSIIPESNIKVMRIMKMITNKRSHDCSPNSSCQHLKKSKENLMENMLTDVMAKMVLIVYIILNQHTALQLAHLMLYFYHHHKKDFVSGLPIPGHSQLL